MKMRYLVPCAAWLLVVPACKKGTAKDPVPKDPTAKEAVEPKKTEAAKAEPKEAAKKEEPAKAEAKGKFHEGILASIKSAGLTVGEFETTAAKPYAAAGCVRGDVEKLDVMLCQYDTVENAKLGETKVSEFIGSAVTGAFRMNGLNAMAVADRNKIDLGGTKINKLLQTFAPKAATPAPPAK